MFKALGFDAVIAKPLQMNAFKDYLKLANR